jgi:hypothetical protein
MSETECCICLQPLFSFESPSQESDVGVLPCGHVLHFTCGSQSLENKAACPICRSANAKKVILHLQTSNFTPVDPTVYLAMVEADYREVTNKNEVLSGRVAAMAATEKELLSSLVRLEKELDSLEKTEAALAGLRDRTLSARAEAEQRRALETCALSTRQSIAESRKKHSQNLRMKNEIDRKIAKVRNEIAKEQVDARKRSRDESVNEFLRTSVLPAPIHHV